MFAVTTIHEDGFEKLVLKDKVNQTSATIIPSCGAILQAFTVWHKDGWVNIIDGYKSKADFDAHVTSKGFKSCKLSPFACRIHDATYRFAGKTYTIEKFLLNGAALHGLIYDAAFTITATWANEHSAGVAAVFEYSGTDKGYPFAYDCAVQYELKKNNALTLTTTITNKHTAGIPVQDGWHPYFSFGGPVNALQLCFKSEALVNLNEQLIPTGTFTPHQDYAAFNTIGDTSFDHCFLLNTTAAQPLCILKDEVQQLQLEIYPGASYPYLQIYTPPHRNSIAIENLSALPDAFNNNTGLLVLAPESAAQFTTTYQVTSLL